MQLKNYLVSNYSFIVAICASFLFASCGSYQYVGYDDGGINGSERVVYSETPVNVSTDANSSSYYKNYFAEKAQQYEDAVNQEDVIFTDIDSYESDYVQELDTLNTLEYQNNGYAGWGQNSTEIVVVDRTIFRPWFGYGFNRWGWGFNRGFYGGFWGDPFWGGGLGGYAFNDPFWYGGYGYGWGWGNRWGWGAGFGYNPWYCPPFYNYGYGNPYYGNRNRYYGNRYGSRIAYNTGRRTNSELGRYSTSRRSNAISRENVRNRFNRDGTISRNRTTRTRDGISRTTRNSTNSIRRPSSTIRRPSNSVNRSTRNGNTRTVRPSSNTRPRVNSTPRRSNNIRSSSPSRSNTIRRSAPVRRSSPSVSRGSRSSSRSSGSIRRNN